MTVIFMASIFNLRDDLNSEESMPFPSIWPKTPTSGRGEQGEIVNSQFS